MNASTANGTKKKTHNIVDHSRSFKYALNSCDCKMYEFTVPWYSCSWTQHICGQQTAGNHKPGLDPVLDKRKVSWEPHRAAARVSRRQHCDRLYGTAIGIFLWIMFGDDTDAHRITYESCFAQELGGGSRSHIVDRNGALGLVQILMICGGKLEKCMFKKKRKRKGKSLQILGAQWGWT